MLLDVASLMRPRLSIMDAIVAMEGKGPGTGGTPRPLGLMLAGTDTVAIDAVCCRIAGFDPAAVPVLSVARDRGLWQGRVADLATLGVPVADLVLNDFQPPAKGIASNGLDAPVIGGLGRRPARSGFSPRPRPQAGPCTICGSCEQACPGPGHNHGQEGPGGPGGRRQVHPLLLLSRSLPQRGDRTPVHRAWAELMHGFGLV